MDAILTNSHLDPTNRTKRYFMIKVIVPKLVRVCRSIGREREVRKTTVNSANNSS